jgi:hypothetical protein
MMRHQLSQWLRDKSYAAPASTPYWIAAFYAAWIWAVWYFDWGVHLW